MKKKAILNEQVWVIHHRMERLLIEDWRSQSGLQI